ncbi:MAG: hypothetical protein C0467_07625 [Planctomycetaceae bacterium]|nr:hypothetical protein [Planctomycetaceae bacterium]
MTLPVPPGSTPDLDTPFTMPEPTRAADPMETPAPGELTAPQLPGLPTSSSATHPGQSCPSSIPGFPDVPGYELVEEIARGGMGIVYAARETTLAREVAIKTLLPALAGHHHFVEQFDREARITARLPHPGVPPVHALGMLPDGRPYLVMKLIRGRTLAAILTARSQRKSTESTSDLDLTTPDAPGLLLVFEQICQAVAFAHSQGIIHRDLKPQNIMVGPFGEVQVMDWGLAKETRNEEIGSFFVDNEPVPLNAITTTGLRTPHSASTQIGSAKGTPSYMPPEQARGEWDTVDARADVFALGGVLCTLLTGSPPYSGWNVQAVVARAMNGDLAETFARLDGCSAAEDLVKLAKWCLSPDPLARPMDARAVAGLVELYRLGQEERARELETVRAAAAGAEAAAWWSALRSTKQDEVGSTEAVTGGPWWVVLSAIVIGVIAGLIIGYR